MPTISDGRIPREIKPSSSRRKRDRARSLAPAQQCLQRIMGGNISVVCHLYPGVLLHFHVSSTRTRDRGRDSLFPAFLSLPVVRLKATCRRPEQSLKSSDRKQRTASSIFPALPVYRVRTHFSDDKDCMNIVLFWKYTVSPRPKRSGQTLRSDTKFKKSAE